jgi:hypothetical protein
MNWFARLDCPFYFFCCTRDRSRSQSSKSVVKNSNDDIRFINQLAVDYALSVTTS